MVRYLIALFCVATSLHAQSWQQEGALKRWTGKAITQPVLGCATGEGNPVVDVGSAIAEVNLTSGALSEHSRGNDAATFFLPRAPKVFASVAHKNTEGAGVTLTFTNSWEGGSLGSVDAAVNVEALQLDVTDTWVADDGREGCAVFAPSSSTPDSLKEYVIIFFRNGETTFIHRVKPKVDVDIYVQPNTEDGLVAYLRGNGISFPPSTEEVFTNGNYLRYDASGRMTRLNLPTRGPGSGKGRFIIWSSVKWDRLLMTDEFASGALLVKASNGIIVDSITSSVVAPGETVKILSASGNINDRWMATHAKVGSKNVLILWAMPDTKEVTSVEFSANDAAKKQMPLSPWTIVIPFLSSADGTNTLFSWNPQDVVSVDEESARNSVTVYPLPATDHVTIVTTIPDGDVTYALISNSGERIATGTSTIVGGTLDISTSTLPSGFYTVELTSTPAHQHTSTPAHQTTSILITR
ncbi:MAG: T9SS C-terminal target domain-containing protein [Ignavibacteriae bacterium]|nr:MAG: T9SS C-terminal target domain-containing protein [Ignavibacteriota bacterium]